MSDIKDLKDVIKYRDDKDDLNLFNFNNNNDDNIIDHSKIYTTAETLNINKSQSPRNRKLENSNSNKSIINID